LARALGPKTLRISIHRDFPDRRPMAHVMGWLRQTQPMQQVAHAQAPTKERRREEDVRSVSSIRAPLQGQYLEEFLDPRCCYLGAGIILYMVLCIVPVWNALALLGDSYYRFWMGSRMPSQIIALCASVVFLFAATSLCFVRAGRPWLHTEQTLIIIANMFVMMLGLGLLLISLPLGQQATDTFNNLMHNCAFNKRTQRLREYSQVLHNIRRTPWCWGKFSVEDCPGYEAVPPYTDFLKDMENDLQCSGFCYQPIGSAAMLEEPMPSLTQADEKTTKKAIQRTGSARLRRRDRLLLSRSRAETKSGSRIRPHPGIPIAGTAQPPTLFSTANYQTSCNAMAARHLRDFAGDIATQLYYQGIYLLVLAIVAGMANAIGVFCRSGRDTKAVAKAKPKATAPARIR